MLVKNISQRRYIHNEVLLDAGATKEIPAEICKIWLKTGDIVKVDDGSKDDEIARLKAENARLKAQAQSETVSELEELKVRAKELKIKGFARMSVDTLKERIEEAEKLLAGE